MRPLIATILMLLGWVTPAPGKIGTIDNVPAATLLFPYFEVDPSTPNGMNTVIAIQNATPTALLLNMTLWTDYGIPTQSFNIYLTGLDLQTVDLYELLVHRNVPVTADDADDFTDTSDPADGISNQGPFSQDINFPGAMIVRDFNVVDLSAAHRGGASEFFGGNCGAHDYGDGRLRGYITVDTIHTHITTNVRTDSMFFQNTATFQNNLFGDYQIVDRANNRMFSDLAVHIEASATDPRTSTGPGKNTFYKRFVGGNAHDHREPLPTAWLGAYSANRTTLQYWRDPGVDVSPFPCGSPPSLFASQKQTLPFDSEENPLSLVPADFFPRAIGTVSIGATGIPASFKRGWIFLNLNTQDSFNQIRQSWMTFQTRPEASSTTTPFGYGLSGVQRGNAANSDNPTIP